MRLVERTGPGALQVSWSWLPTWIGMNVNLIRELDEHLGKSLLGRELTEETLDLANEKALSFLEEKFKDIPGLFEYLDGLKYVMVDGNAAAQHQKEEEGRASSSSG